MNSYANCKFDEKNQLVETLKTKEKELCEIRITLCECKEECSRLNKMNGVLETELKSLNMKFTEEKSSAARMEERLTLERDSLRNELEIKCRQLSDLETRYVEDRHIAEDQKCKYNKLFTTLTEVNKVIVQNHYEMKNQVDKLQKELCTKKDELSTLKKKVKELGRENDFSVMEINAQKNKVFEKECNIKRLMLITDKIMKIKQTCDACFCPEKKIEKPIITCTKPKCGMIDLCCNQIDPCTKPTSLECTKNVSDDC